MNNKINILVLGASGMLGNAILRFFESKERYNVKGAVRSESSISMFPKEIRDLVISGLNIDDEKGLSKIIKDTQAEIVINCIGVVKQLSESSDPLIVLPVNSIFPHRLLKICKESNSRLIHISTDCVFDGSKGMYSEEDKPDAHDLYGLSKFLGEVKDTNAITLRTSIIGHELNSASSLIDWFLSQNGEVKGYKNAIFSGLPTNEVARVIEKFVIPNNKLIGLYHLSANPINKFELLSIVAEIYNKNIMIHKDENFVINRSLDSTRFRNDTGYSPQDWYSLIKNMYESYNL